VAKTDRVRGTIQKIGLEGGIWALISEAGESIELLGCPSELKESGLHVELELQRDAADATIGMMGSSASVRSFRVLR
jgi:hypothetical protein